MRWAVLSFIPENTITFSYKRNLWPNTASKLAVQILTYLKQYAPFCPTIFSLSLAQILRLPRKIKTKCIFRVIAFLFLAASQAYAGQNNWAHIADEIEKALHSALKSYEDGKASDAMEKVADAYFGVFEGDKANMEIAVRRFISLKKAVELEKGFSNLRKAMFDKAPLTNIKKQATLLIRAVKEAAGKLDGKGVRLE